MIRIFYLKETIDHYICKYINTMVSNLYIHIPLDLITVFFYLSKNKMYPLQCYGYKPHAVNIYKY